MNFITDFPLNIKLGIRTLLIIVNQFNKGVILIPILLISALAVAIAFIKHYIPYHEFLKAIISNKDT